MIAARDDGLVAAIGLSNITSAHLLHALRVTDVACVQNEFHLANRVAQPVLDSAPGGGSVRAVRIAGLRRGWPRRCPQPAQPCSEAARLGVTPAQVAVGLVAGRRPEHVAHPRDVLPASPPGDLAAASVHLDADAVRRLSAT